MILSHNYPSVLLLNARSLCNKLDELRILISNQSPGCVVVTETWFKDDIPSECLNVQHYVLFRSDRKDRVGGGVCIYVHESFKPVKLRQMSVDCIETLSVVLSSVNVIVWSFYIPPNLSAAQHRTILENTIETFDSYMDSLSNLRFIFCGDFNDFNSNVFHENFSCVNRVTSSTRGNALLDQICISEELQEFYPNSADIGPPLANSDHNCVFLVPTSTTKQSCKTTRTVFDYRRGHIRNFLHHLSNSTFDDVYNAVSVNGKCAAFYEIFYSALSVIPCRDIVIYENDKPWITPVLKKLIEDRWIAFRSRNWPVYNHLKEKVKTEIFKAKQSWSNKILSRDKNVWNVVREFQGRNVPTKFSVNGSNPHRFIAELSSVFESCFNNDSDATLLNLPNECWNLDFDAYDVHCILKD